MDLSDAYVSKHSPRPRWTLATLRQRAVGLIESWLHEPGLDMAWIARSLGCSIRYVQLAFAEWGETPSTYLWRRRVERAYDLLADAEDERSISDVAFALGFSSSAHFSRLFRQRYDCSPREARLNASLRPRGTCR